MADYVVSIDSIEKASDIDLFRNLNDEFESILEASPASAQNWPFYDRHPEIGCFVR